jgi:enamine deaminase RidA (YjgF/YER057c/UK114 family)
VSIPDGRHILYDEDNFENFLIFSQAYRQTVEVNGSVFVSGRIPLIPATGDFTQGGSEELTQRPLEKVRTILRKRTFVAMNNVYAGYFKQSESVPTVI